MLRRGLLKAATIIREPRPLKLCQHSRYLPKAESSFKKIPRQYQEWVSRK